MNPKEMLELFYEKVRISIDDIDLFCVFALLELLSDEALYLACLFLERLSDVDHVTELAESGCSERLPDELSGLFIFRLQLLESLLDH